MHRRKSNGVDLSVCQSVSVFHLSISTVDFSEIFSLRLLQLRFLKFLLLISRKKVTYDVKCGPQ